MSGIIFGVFSDRERADAAVAAVEAEAGPQGINAFVHEESLRDEDVQMRGTDAMRGALMGAGMVGVLGAVVGCLLLIPAADLSIGWTEWFILMFAGSLFGITAGAVAGASEARAEIRAMARKLEQGNVLVTMEATEMPAATIVELLVANGASEAKAA